MKKKLLLVVLLSMGLANISQAGFFDNTCDSVEEKANKLEVNSKQINRMREEAKNDRSKENEHMVKIRKTEYEIYQINAAMQKECKEQQYHCKVCSKWKELEELRNQEDRDRKKAWDESDKRASEMLKR
jgi:hypothetical protein